MRRPSFLAIQLFDFCHSGTQSCCGVAPCERREQAARFGDIVAGYRLFGEQHPAFEMVAIKGCEIRQTPGTPLPGFVGPDGGKCQRDCGNRICCPSGGQNIFCAPSPSRPRQNARPEHGSGRKSRRKRKCGKSARKRSVVICALLCFKGFGCEQHGFAPPCGVFIQETGVARFREQGLRFGPLPLSRCEIEQRIKNPARLGFQVIRTVVNSRSALCVAAAHRLNEKATQTNHCSIGSGEHRVPGLPQRVLIVVELSDMRQQEKRKGAVAQQRSRLTGVLPCFPRIACSRCDKSAREGVVAATRPARIHPAPERARRRQQQPQNLCDKHAQGAKQDRQSCRHARGGGYSVVGHGQHERVTQAENPDKPKSNRRRQNGETEQANHFACAAADGA